MQLKKARRAAACFETSWVGVDALVITTRAETQRKVALAAPLVSTLQSSQSADARAATAPVCPPGAAGKSVREKGQDICQADSAALQSDDVEIIPP